MTTFALTPEIASEFDFILCIDASGSMTNPSKRFAGKNRYEEVQELAQGIAAAVGQYDSDGIDIIVFGGDVKVHEGVTAEKVAEVFASRQPYGGTPLLVALNAVISKHNATSKNVVAIIFTDGEPSEPKDAVAQAIIGASNALEKDEKLTLLFVQIGDDAGATTFLTYLDDGLTAAKFDIVDAISAAEAETMAPLALIEKAIND